MSQRTRYCSRCLTTFTNDVDRCPNLSCRTVRPQAGWGELLEAGETIDRTYRIRQRLAIGGAGVTYLAREIGAKNEEIGPLLAVKVLYQQRDQGPYLRRLATEAQILQGLNHAQIVECRGFVHRSGHSPYLVTRFEAGGSLLDHIRRVGTLSIPVTANLGRQICWALEVAHRQHVVHRDLKPENVLLVKQVTGETIPDLKVADFGIAKVSGGIGDRLTRVGAFIGTPQYAAPEQFEGVTPEPAADIYALGAVMYFCLTARPVADFMGELDPDDLREQLVRHLPVRLTELNAPGHLRRWMEDTLALAMTVEPSDRCDLATLDRRLADIAAERDPGHVPVAPLRDLPTSTPTISAGMLEVMPVGPNPEEPRPSTDEHFREERSRIPAHAPVSIVGGRPPRPWSSADSPDAVVPDPAAGTADPAAPPPLPPVNIPDPVLARLNAPPRPPLPVDGALPPLPVDAPPPLPVDAPPPLPAEGAAVPEPDPDPVPPPPPRVSTPPADPFPPPPPRVAPPPADPFPPPPPADPFPLPPRVSPVPDAPSRPSGSASPPRSTGYDPLADSRSPAFPDEAPRSRAGTWMGLGVVGVLGGVGLLLVVVGIVVGLLWDSGPPRLTGTETDPVVHRDWELIAGALGQLGVRAERACQAPKYLQVEATVQPDGTVTHVDLLNYAFEPTRACMEKELGRAPLPRNAGAPVRVAISLQE